MASFNRVILLGNITRDIEVKYLQSGMAVTEVGLAVNDRRKNQQGEWIEETTFVDVTLWGRTAEIAAEYLNKGSQVMIEGRLKLDTWETDGQKRSKLKVVGEKMVLCGSRGGSGGGARGGAGGAPSQQYDDGADYGEQSGPPSGQPAGSSARAAASRSAPPSAPAPPTGDDIPF